MDMPGNDTNVKQSNGVDKEAVNYNAPNNISMVDSFCPPMWDPMINIRDNTNWTPNAADPTEGLFPPSLPHFPADSGFIERAARFSCFNGGHFSQMLNPLSMLDPMNPTSHLGLVMQRPNEAFVEISKEDSLLMFKNEKKTDSFTQSKDETKNGVDLSDEAEFSGRDGQDDSSGKSVIGLKKRKRIEKKPVNNVNNEALEPDDEIPSSTSNPSGKGPDPPKEQEYIHVRARRGQATNSHSLAERIRREKISERMKFLQDLVPGCSKVTGKAVMLDEIINYVQSLQRQVEFLSMKLATVNPRLDFNVEGFLAKDILQTRAGLSSSLVFPPDMITPFLPIHPQQPGLIQMGPVSGGYREPTSQAPGVWDDELHNIVHNGFNST